MNDLTVQNEKEIGLPVEQVIAQAEKIQELMKSLMKKDEHFGVIPGIASKKPSLFKAGAEKLCFTFRFIPAFKIERKSLPDGHREYEIICTLTHQATGAFMGEGVGICSTMESKYRYRTKNKECPNCGAESIIKGKAEYGGGWLCFAKKGGCGAKFNDVDPSITSQKDGKVENPDIADTYNTVLKMAKKRAHVDATITACAASDIFTQDLEDLKSMNPGPADTPAAKKDDKPTNVLADEKTKVYQEIMNILNMKDNNGNYIFIPKEKIENKKKADAVKDNLQELNKFHGILKRHFDERNVTQGELPI